MPLSAHGAALGPQQWVCFEDFLVVFLCLFYYVLICPAKHVLCPTWSSSVLFSPAGQSLKI